MSFLTTAAVVGTASTVAGTIGSLTASKPKAPPPRDLGQELQSLAGQYPDLASMLTGGSGNFNTSASQGIGQLTQGTTLNTQAYQQARPDLVNNYNSDPGYAQMYGSLENYLRADFDANEPNKAQYLTGGLPEVAGGLNTQNRTSNLADVANLSEQYQGIIQGANQPYYDQLSQFTQASNAPVQQSAAQQAALAQAQQGFGSFDPSGLYANTNFTSQQVNAASGNPLLDALNQRALTQSGPGELQSQQNAIAKQLLLDGGNLSQSDLRNVQQASRGGFAARGLGGTNASVVDEVLQTDAAQRARLLQNIGIAQGVQNQGMNEQNLQQQFGLGVGAQNFGYDQLGLQGQQANQAANLQAQQLGLQGQIANQGFGLNSFNANLASQTAQQGALQGLAGLSEQQRQAQLAAMQAATNAQAQGRIDPYAAILGGTNDQLGALLGLYGQGQNQQSNLLSSLLGYGQDLSNTNYNANAAANIAGYNQQAANNSSLIGAGTNLLGSYLGQQGGANTQMSGNQLLSMIPNSALRKGA